jgi:hypothetical protein
MTPSISRRQIWYRRGIVGGTALLTSAAIGIGIVGVRAASPSPAGTSWSLALSSANPSFGSAASFAVTDPPTKNNPEISVNCSKNGQNVYLDVHGQSQGAGWTNFTLWSQQWANAGGGAASCVAQLFYYTWQGKTETGVTYVAQTSFAAA